MIKIVKNTDINNLQWFDLINRSNTVSFFQTKACYDFYCKLSYLDPILFGIEENSKLVGLICGYLTAEGGFLKNYFSRRIIIPGGLLLDKNISKDAIEYLLISFKKYISTKANYIEIRNLSDYSKFIPQIENVGFKYKKHLNFHLNTSSTELVIKNISTSKRRQIKLTEKAGVECVISKETNDIKEFYKILKDLHKSKIKTPLFPFNFFETFIQQDFAKFFVVKLNSETLGGICCVTQNKTIYEWYICGVDTKETKQKKIFPSVYATFSAIKFASENGYQIFDFMGAGTPNKAYGVREFKSKFGGELVEHGRFIYICKPIIYKFSEFIISLKLFNQ